MTTFLQAKAALERLAVTGDGDDLDTLYGYFGTVPRRLTPSIRPDELTVVPVCETPRQEQDELFCWRCGLRWGVDEEKPPCPRR